MHIDELDFTLEDFPVGAYNYDAYGLCCVLASAYAAHTAAFIGGGDAVDRMILKNALLKAWKDEKAACHCLNGGEFTDSILDAIHEGTLDEFKERCREAEILLLDDVQYLGGKAATQEVFYDILKTRYESTKLTVLFADRPYALLKDHFRTDLYELMGGGDIASLAAPDRWEEFFFENDYDKMLRFTFLNADGEAACTDEEAKTLAAFLERMSYVHVRAAAWAVLIAASGSSEYFTSEMAMRILSKREGVMEEYEKLLLETLEDALDDEQIDAYFRAPFVWAAQETLKKPAD